MSITDTIIVPKKCRESYFNLHQSESALLRSCDISGGGISEIYPPYHIIRYRPRHHLFAYTFMGGAVLQRPSGQKVVKKGEVILLPAGQVHDYKPIKVWKKVWLHLDDTKRWNFLKEVGYQKFDIQTGGLFVAAMRGFWEETFETEIRTNANRLANQYAEIICEYLNRILSPKNANAGQKHLESLKRVWKTVNENLHVRWQVEDLAEKVNLSAVQFHRLNAKYFGKTPIKFLTELRMVKARHLLMNTSLTLEVIAGMVGYESAFSFSRAFKSFNKISPQHFRMQSKGE